MPVNHVQLFIAGTIAALLILLFVGQFYDHHGDKNLYIKSRPSFTLFSNPAKAGQSESENFDTAQKTMEADTAAFIVAGLIQMTIMLLVAGAFAFFKKKLLSGWQLMIQFLLHFIITYFAVIIMLFSDDLSFSIIVFPLLAATNYLLLLFNHKLEITFPVTSNEEKKQRL